MIYSEIYKNQRRSVKRRSLRIFISALFLILIILSICFCADIPLSEIEKNEILYGSFDFDLNFKTVSDYYFIPFNMHRYVNGIVLIPIFLFSCIFIANFLPLNYRVRLNIWFRIFLLDFIYNTKEDILMNTNDKSLQSDMSHDPVVGLAVCSKCNLINKIRSTDTLKKGKCICAGCGSAIDISRKIKNI